MRNTIGYNIFAMVLISLKQVLSSNINVGFQITLGTICLFGFLTFSSGTTLYHGRVPRLTSDNFTCLPNTRQSGSTITSVSAGHIILTQTQPVRQPQQELNPLPPHQKLRALPTELPRPLTMGAKRGKKKKRKKKKNIMKKKRR